MKRRVRSSEFQAGVIIFLMLGTMFASGCIFTPRDAETPDSDGAAWIRPDTPLNVLANMKSALEAFASNTYDDSISESSYTFIPSSSAEQGAPPDYFANWDAQKEIAALSTLYTQASAISLDWVVSETDVQTDGNVATVYVQDYQYSITYNSGATALFHGRAELDLEFSSGIWELVTWDESNNGADLSSGHLRVNLNVID